MSLAVFHWCLHLLLAAPEWFLQGPLLQRQRHASLCVSQAGEPNPTKFEGHWDYPMCKLEALDYLQSHPKGEDYIQLPSSSEAPQSCCQRQHSVLLYTPGYPSNSHLPHVPWASARPRCCWTEHKSSARTYLYRCENSPHSPSPGHWCCLEQPRFLWGPVHPHARLHSRQDSSQIADPLRGQLAGRATVWYVW